MFASFHFRPRTLILLIKACLLLFALFVLFGLFLWELHIELAFYSRNWISEEVHKIEPLAGCFDPTNISPLYNLSEAVYGPKRTEVHSGLPLRLGMDCYEFAGTISSAPHDSNPSKRYVYHTYWRTDLTPFGPRQEWMLKSFFATQDTQRARLILWSNGDLSENPLIRKWMAHYPHAFSVRMVDYEQLARGTALEGSELLSLKDKRAWIDGDLVRLLVIWAMGGVWVDMDSLLTRDLAPLLEHEFVTQWDCYGKPKSNI